MIKKALLALYVFVLLFSPPIFPGGLRSMYVLTAVSLFLLAVEYRKEVKEVLAKSNISIVVRLFIALALYTAVITLVSTSFGTLSLVDSLAKMLLTGPALAMCIVFLLAVFKRSKYTLNDALKVVIYAGIIQSVLAVVAFLVPDVKALFVSIMQHNVGTAALFDPFQIETRLFGFAGDMFDRFGYGMGMMTALPALLAYNTGRLRYLLLIPLMLVAIILNSRTGILIAIVSAGPLILLTLRKYAMNTRRLKATIAGICMVLLGVFGGIAVINGVYDASNQNIRKYTTSNYDSIFQFISGGDTSSGQDNTAELLFSDRFWEMPNTPGAFLFGTGHSKYGVEGLSHSDIGYVNDVWMFGFIVTIIAYTIFIYFTLMIARFGIQYKLLATGLLLAFFLYQIKGVAFWSANIGIALHIMIVAIIYYYGKTAQLPKVKR